MSEDTENSGRKISIENVGGDFVAGDKHIHLPQKHIPHDLTHLPDIVDLEREVIGREADLESLGQQLESDSMTVLLNGMGGIGKTTLAMAYLKLHKMEYQHVAWITQLTGLPESFSSSVQLKESLNLHFTDELPEEQFMAIGAALRKLPGKNLLVIDNADKSLGDLRIRQHLPGDGWKILATSRQEIGGFASFNVDQLRPEDAEKLFRQHYTPSMDQGDLNALLEYIEYHTLTVELIAKTLARRLGTVSVAEMLAYLKKHQLDEAAIQRKIEVRHGEEWRDERTVRMYSHILNTFEMEGMDGYWIWLLQQFAVLPSEPQPVNRMREWLKISEDAERFEDGIYDLAGAGWLRRVSHDEDGEMVAIHRMVREVVLMKHRPGFQTIVNLAKSVTALIRTDDIKSNPVDKFPLVIYGRSLLSYIDIISRPAIVLKSVLANLYRQMGKFQESANLFERALSDSISLMGEKNIMVTNCRSNLALVYQDLGRYQESLTTLKATLQSLISFLGPDHPTVATCRSNLGLAYLKFGKREKAASLFEAALQNAIANSNSNDPIIDRYRSNLALAYCELGRFSEAEDLLRTAIQRDIMNLGESHPDVAIRINSLAMLLQDIGRIDEASELMRLVVKNDISNFGESHPSVFRSQSNLALVYHDLGRYHEAVSILEKVLANVNSHFGSEHTAVARSKSNLAMTYQELGRTGEAIELLEDAIRINISYFGPMHPEVITPQSNLAIIYIGIGRKNEAKNILERVLQSEISHYGGGHHTVAKGYSNLATVYRDLGRFSEAENLLTKALEIGILNFGEDHQGVATTYANLAMVCKDLGQIERANHLGRKAHEIMTRIMGEKHPKTLVAKEILESINQSE